jgi:Domain of unknown function (DUF4296)
MNKYFCLFLLVMLSYQCNNEESLPIEEITLSNVLTDIHIAEAAVDYESVEMKDSLTRLYYSQIFERNGIKQWQFDTSLSVLSRNPVQMERIFSQVINNIKKQDTLSKK